MEEIGLKIGFWISVTVVVYVYLGYPLLIYFLARFTRPQMLPRQELLPSVTLLISAYNEKDVIREKLVNALSLDYQRDRLQLIVISDCSDDGTDEIVKDFTVQGVLLVRQLERLGKTAGLNLGISCAAGSILVFSDANAMYEPAALRHLVKHFASPNVGYVVGNARYVQAGGKSPSAESEGIYWSLETWLKCKESEFGSVVGGDGAIYAIRRELYTPLVPTDINDLVNPLQIIARGYRGVYERAAVCFEEAGDSFEKEFRRKVRIIGRSLNAIRRVPAVLLPWTQPRHWFSLISHKVLRWTAPLFLIFVFIIGLLFWALPLYRLLTILQASFYALALVAWVVGRYRSFSRFLYLPYYFCVMNIASLFGLFDFLRGSLSPTWTPIRQQDLTAEHVSSAAIVRRES